MITSESILMSKYIAKSINQTTDYRMFWPRRSSLTVYKTHATYLLIKIDSLVITNVHTVLRTIPTDYLCTGTHHTTFRYLVSSALFDSYPFEFDQRDYCCRGVDVICYCWHTGFYSNSQNSADARLAA